MPLAVLFLLSGCGTLGPADDEWFARDKAQHFVAAAAIGAGVSVASESWGAEDGERVAWGVGAAATAGAGKEAWDAGVRKTYWSWKDFVWDLLGGLAGSAAAAAAAD